ncbi:MAG TPA: glutaminase A [Bacillales bacterium]|nr:glutaminase A [Bacillales bacterium]
MAEINTTYLEKAIEACRPFAAEGEVNKDIPGIDQSKQSHLGITIMTEDNEIYRAGEYKGTTSLQSCSKIISLMLALHDFGKERVFETVGMEPMGALFNSISHLESFDTHKPMNPMINAGAIAVASLIKGQNVEHRFERILDLIRTITQNPDLCMNEAVYESEKKRGSRNRSLAYFMKSTGTLVSDVEDALDLYFRFNSIDVHCEDLARIGLFFANGGYPAGSSERLISARHLRTIQAIMMTSGMYNESGRFAVEVGFPCKSGVSGNIIGVVPEKMGIGVIGPAINVKGNSTAGGALLRKISVDLDLNMFGFVSRSAGQDISNERQLGVRK